MTSRELLIFILAAIGLLGMFVFALAVWDRTTARHKKIVITGLIVATVVAAVISELLGRHRIGIDLLVLGVGLGFYYWDLGWWKRRLSDTWDRNHR